MTRSQVAWARIEAETILRREMRRKAKGKSVDGYSVAWAKAFFVRHGVIEGEMRGVR